MQNEYLCKLGGDVQVLHSQSVTSPQRASSSHHDTLASSPYGSFPTILGMSSTTTDVPPMTPSTFAQSHMTQSNDSPTVQARSVQFATDIQQQQASTEEESPQDATRKERSAVSLDVSDPSSQASTLDLQISQPSEA